MKSLPLVDFRAIASKGCLVYCFLRGADSQTAKAGSPYYVGITRKTGNYRRPYRSRQKGTKPPADRTLVRVLRSGLSLDEACHWERFYIQKYGRKVDGGILLNRSIGGDGGDGVRWTEEQKRSQSERLKGKAHSAAHNAKVSQGLKRYKRTEQHARNLAKAQAKRKGIPAGWKHTPESKAKISAGNKKKRHPSEKFQLTGLANSRRAAERYGLDLADYLTLSRQHRINMSTWLKRKPGRTPRQYVELYGAAA